MDLEFIVGNAPLTNNRGDDFDVDEYLTQSGTTFNRVWSWTDPLREGAANVVHKLDNSAMETERLQSLIGLDDNQFIEAVRSGRVRREEWPLGRMSPARRDALLQAKVTDRLNWQQGINDVANSIAPTPHADPDGITDKALYETLKFIPGALESVAEYMAFSRLPFGQAAFAVKNTLAGNDNANEQVYTNLRNQGKTIDEARQGALGIGGQAANLGIQGAANAATMHFLGKNPLDGANSPIANLAGNTGIAMGAAGLGTAGSSALTDYRSENDIDWGKATKQGAIAAGTTGLFALANAAMHGRKLWEAQKEYYRNKPIDVNGRWLPNDEPPALGEGDRPTPPDDMPPSSDGNALALPEPTTEEAAANFERYNNAVEKHGFTKMGTFIGNGKIINFSITESLEEITQAIKKGNISLDDAVNMLVEGGFTQDIARNILNDSINNSISSTENTQSQTTQPTNEPQTFTFEATPDWQDPLSSRVQKNSQPTKLSRVIPQGANLQRDFYNGTMVMEDPVTGEEITVFVENKPNSSIVEFSTVSRNDNPIAHEQGMLGLYNAKNNSFVKAPETDLNMFKGLRDGFTNNIGIFYSPEEEKENQTQNDDLFDHEATENHEQITGQENVSLLPFGTVDDTVGEEMTLQPQQSDPIPNDDNPELTASIEEFNRRMGELEKEREEWGDDEPQELPDSYYTGKYTDNNDDQIKTWRAKLDILRDSGRPVMLSSEPYLTHDSPHTYDPNYEAMIPEDTPEKIEEFMGLLQENFAILEQALRDDIFSEEHKYLFPKPGTEDTYDEEYFTEKALLAEISENGLLSDLWYAAEIDNNETAQKVVNLMRNHLGFAENDFRDDIEANYERLIDEGSSNIGEVINAKPNREKPQTHGINPIKRPNVHSVPLDDPLLQPTTRKKENTSLLPFSSVNQEEEPDVIEAELVVPEYNQQDAQKWPVLEDTTPQSTLALPAGKKQINPDVVRRGGVTHNEELVSQYYKNNNQDTQDNAQDEAEKTQDTQKYPLIPFGEFARRELRNSGRPKPKTYSIKAQRPQVHSVNTSLQRPKVHKLPTSINRPHAYSSRRLLSVYSVSNDDESLTPPKKKTKNGITTHTFDVSEFGSDGFAGQLEVNFMREKHQLGVFADKFNQKEQIKRFGENFFEIVDGEDNSVAFYAMDTDEFFLTDDFAKKGWARNIEDAFRDKLDDFLIKAGFYDKKGNPIGKNQSQKKTIENNVSRGNADNTQNATQDGTEAIQPETENSEKKETKSIGTGTIEDDLDNLKNEGNADVYDPITKKWSRENVTVTPPPKPVKAPENESKFEAFSIPAPDGKGTYEIIPNTYMLSDNRPDAFIIRFAENNENEKAESERWGLYYLRKVMPDNTSGQQEIKNLTNYLENAIHKHLRENYGVIPQDATLKGGMVDISGMEYKEGTYSIIGGFKPFELFTQWRVIANNKEETFSFYDYKQKGTSLLCIYDVNSDTFSLRNNNSSDNNPIMKLIERKFRQDIRDFYTSTNTPDNQEQNQSETITDNKGQKKNSQKLNEGILEVTYDGKNYKLKVKPWIKKWFKRLYINQPNNSGKGKKDLSIGYYDAVKKSFGGFDDNNQGFNEAVQKTFLQQIKNFVDEKNHEKEDDDVKKAIESSGDIDNVLDAVKNTAETKKQGSKIIPNGTTLKDGTLNIPGIPDSNGKFNVTADNENNTLSLRNLAGEFIYYVDDDMLTHNGASQFGDAIKGAVERELRKHITDFYTEEKSEITSENTQSSNQNDNALNPYLKIANEIKRRVLEVLENEDAEITPISNDDLLKIANDAFGGTKGEGAYTPKDAYDAMELGINMAIRDSKRFNQGISKSEENVIDDIQVLGKILKLIPTQRNRTQEQIDFQQFSTPPTLAYLVNWLANISDGQIVLEPSAGLGGLAVFAHNSGAELLLNELSDRRADLLNALGLNVVPVKKSYGKDTDAFRENAEHIGNNLIRKLTNEQRPDRVIMNPPFSATAGRVKAHNTKNAIMHVEEALQLLKDNGRLVAILGKGMDENSSTFKKWWQHIKKKYNLVAIIHINGDNYKKYGTTFGNIIAVIDKNNEKPKYGTIYYNFTGSFENPDDVERLIATLRDIRESSPISDNVEHKEAQTENKDANSEKQEEKQNADTQIKRTNDTFITPEEIENPENFAWHGTPNIVDGDFSLAYVGTGEGHQAFAYGLYFAESEAAGRTYMRGRTPALVNIILENGTIIDDKNEIFGLIYRGVSDNRVIPNDYSGKDFAQVREAFKKQIENSMSRIKNAPQFEDTYKKYQAALEVLDNAKSFTVFNGNLYKAKMPPRDLLISYDAPISEQPKKVHRALDKIKDKAKGWGISQGAVDSLKRASTGGAFYVELKKAMSEFMMKREKSGKLPKTITRADMAASFMLNRYGVPGLLFWDRQSRDAKSGTHNYVIWNTDLIKMIAISPDSEQNAIDAFYKAHGSNTPSTEAKTKTSPNEPNNQKNKTAVKESALRNDTETKNPASFMAQSMLDMYNEDNGRRIFYSIPKFKINAIKNGFSSEQADEFLKILRDQEIIQVHMGDASLMTREEVDNCFYDENGFRLGTFTIQELDNLKALANGALDPNDEPIKEDDKLTPETGRQENKTAVKEPADNETERFAREIKQQILELDNIHYTEKEAQAIANFTKTIFEYIADWYWGHYDNDKTPFEEVVERFELLIGDAEKLRKDYNIKNVYEDLEGAFTTYTKEHTLIGMSKNGKKSYLLHEIAHLFLDELGSAVRNARRKGDVKPFEDFGWIAEELGFKEFAQDNMSLEDLVIDKKQFDILQEFFARAFEAYFFSLEENIAPNLAEDMYTLKDIARQSYKNEYEIRQQLFFQAVMEKNDDYNEYDEEDETDPTELIFSPAITEFFDDLLGVKRNKGSKKNEDNKKAQSSNTEKTTPRTSSGSNTETSNTDSENTDTKTYKTKKVERSSTKPKIKESPKETKPKQEKSTEQQEPEPEPQTETGSSRAKTTRRRTKTAIATEQPKGRRISEIEDSNAPSVKISLKSNKDRAAERKTDAKAEQKNQNNNAQVKDTDTPDVEELSINSRYRSSISGFAPHPGILDESTAMKSVTPPPPSYIPKLPREVQEKGLLSDAQIEPVIYAGQSFRYKNADGTRRGYYIGDGTGVGKGREISAIIMDVLAHGYGKGKAVWLSDKHSLIKDAKRDWSGLGNNPDDIFAHENITDKKLSDRDSGIIFSAYSYMESDKRIGELKKWLGENFDGIIVLDECHNVNNVVDVKEGRGTKKAAKAATNTRDFIKAFPDARILYVSATGATEVRNLAMLDRLGLWGHGTQFESASDFVTSISKGGTAAMEMTARDLKAMGLFNARSLSMDGVTYRTLLHTLTPHQKAIYDKLAECWQIILHDISNAIQICGGEDSKKRASAISQFWGAHQRFFNQIIVTLQTPAVIADIEKQLNTGNSAVIQLTNTFEANQENAVKKLKNSKKNEEEISYEDLDISPKETMITFLEKCFPTEQMEDYEDEEGNIKQRPVLDKDGKPIINEVAVSMREALIEQVNSIQQFPESPLDLILEHFGADNVAEITGRSRRFTRDATGKIVEEKRNERIRQAEINDFNEGRKRILIFSDKGGTGASYHTSNDYINKQKRIHYLLQPGWRADKAMQGLGRTHRSNEANQPEYVLVTTDIPGQKRFISTIARRLGQLGALSTGERKSTTQGIFSEDDNLEASYIQDAVNELFRNIMDDEYPELGSVEDVLSQLGINPKSVESGIAAQARRKWPDVTKFLNRILSMKVDMQKKIFARFEECSARGKEIARINGLLDQRAENIRAQKINVLQEETVAYDKQYGTATKYVELEIVNPLTPRTFESVKRRGATDFYLVDTGDIVAAVPREKSKTEVATGEISQAFTLYFVNPRAGTKEVPAHILANKSIRQMRHYEKLSEADAKRIWEEHAKQLPKTYSEKRHMITGALLPVWKRLGTSKLRIQRAITGEGENERSFLGRVIPNDELTSTLAALSISYGRKKSYTPEKLREELNDVGMIATLSNRLKLKYVRVNGERRIEILNFDLVYQQGALIKDGAIQEYINGKSRLFVPNGNNSMLEKLIKENPVVNVTRINPMDDYADDVNSSIDAYNPRNLYFIPPFFRPDPDKNPYINTAKSKYGFSSSETEKRWQDSKKPKKEKVSSLIKEAATRLIKGFRSDLPELLDDDNLIYAQELLRKLKRERKADVQETINRQLAALNDLTPDDFDLFERAMQIMDLQETKELDSEAGLPWGLSDNSIQYEYNRIMREVDKNERVANAIEKAEILGRDLSDELSDAADDLQMFDIRDKLKRKHYYRHIVLEYYRQTKGNAKSSKVKNTQRRGYLKHRGGSEKDISSDWIMSMGEVWTRMEGDIKTLRTLKKLRDRYDIIESLKQRAFAINKENAEAEIMKSLRGLPEDLRKYKAADMLSRQLLHKQAQAISRLFKLAKSGDLPAGDNNEWLELLGQLADAGTLERLDDNTREKFSRYIGWLSSIEEQSRARSIARRFLRGDVSKQSGLKKILGDKYVNWQDLIPDDYELWSPSDSRIVFSANTVSENVLLIAQENIDELLGVPLSDIGRALNSGGSKQLWCIPEKLANTLNNLGKSQPQGMLKRGAKWAMNCFKRWVLLTPAGGRVIKYNWRNFFGDLEAVLQGNPNALYYLKQACEELSKSMLKGGVATGLLAEFQKRGGGLTTEFINEIENWQDLKEFANLFENKNHVSPLKMASNVFKGYVKIASTLTNFRENILRYAAFLSYVKMIEDNNGEAPFYGMSKPKEVQALSDDIYDMAFKLANENLGAYDQVSENMKWLRDNCILTFGSWLEVNFKRSVQMYKNIWNGNSYLEYWIRKHGDDFIAKFGGGGKEPPNNGGNNNSGFDDDFSDDAFKKFFKKLRKVLGKSPAYILRFAITLALSAPLMIVLSIFNWLNSENDAKLTPDVRNTPHLTLNTNAYNGEVLYMGRLGSALDFFETIGTDGITKDLKDIFDGKMSIGELPLKIVNGPISKLVNNLNPYAKALIEMAYGRRLYPDISHPAPIRDNIEYLAQSLNLDWYYKMLTGKPHKPASDLAGSVANAQAPEQAAYWFILSRKREFQEKVLGREYDGYSKTKKGEALYNARVAASMGDRKLMRKYLKEYYRAGGDYDGLNASVNSMNPMFGLDEDEQLQFVKWLPKEERKILRKADKFYQRINSRMTF